MISATSNEDSGTKHRSTSPLAKVACKAMKPECLPINLTMPIPFGQASASVFAASIMGMAASTAEVKPNELSINGTCVERQRHEVMGGPGFDFEAVRTRRRSDGRGDAVDAILKRTLRHARRCQLFLGHNTRRIFYLFSTFRRLFYRPLSWSHPRR